MECKQKTKLLFKEAIEFLKGKVLRTPLEFSPYLSEQLKTPVYLKLESLQITGSFKVRGALFYLSTLDAEKKKQGVVTCSAGNHGLAVAYAARLANVPCIVYVPKNVDETKKRKIVQFGAQVIPSPYIGYDDTLAWTMEKIKSTQQHFITPYDDDRIMAANGGTIAAEIFEDLDEVENVIFPVGGGGLGGGLSYYLQSVKPSVRLIGCQHIDSPALQLSLQQGRPITCLPAIETIAGGLEGGIGMHCFNVLKDLISETALVSEEEIRHAVRWMLQHHQYLAEASAVAGIASCLHGKINHRLTGKTVIVVTGRNIAFSTLQDLLV